jgi:broad specificity phosphatase PhoE
MDLMGEERYDRWKQAPAAVNWTRDRFGESAVSLAAGMRGRFQTVASEYLDAVVAVCHTVNKYCKCWRFFLSAVLPGSVSFSRIFGS